MGANPFLNLFWDKLPKKGEKTGTMESATVDFAVLTKQLQTPFLVYSGSLTTPPLSEGVQWIVMKQNLACSKGQLQKFVQQLGISNNARPPQPLFGRTIEKMSNAQFTSKQVSSLRHS